MKKLILVLSVVAMAAFLLVGCLPVKNIAPVITTTSLPGGTVGTAYTATVNATDADGDTLTFSLSGGPTDMVINSATGVISGWTPAAVGTVNVTVTVTDGTDPVSSPFTIIVELIPGEITITVAGEYFEAATGKTYVKGGGREITVTFPAAVDNPVVKVGTVEVPVFTVDNKVFKGTGAFVGPCDAVLITVSGVCEDICAAKSVVVDSGNPYAKLKAKVIECDCEEGYKLKVYSDWLEETDCEDLTGCCGDDCSLLASWNIKIYDENPWAEECCVPDPCIDPFAEADGTECPVTITTECIDEVYTEDGWIDYFDGDYWVIATLTDNVGNEIKYYGWVGNKGMGDELGGELESFVELYIDPTSEDCWCPAENPDDADLIIGDCDGTPTTECWVEPLDPCPIVILWDSEGEGWGVDPNQYPLTAVQGQKYWIGIYYGNAEKPDCFPAAYIGPAIKGFPVGIPDDAQELTLVKYDDVYYEGPYTFGQAGTDYIYVNDCCEDCTPCKYAVTVLPADVCPVVEFLDYTWWEEVDGKGFTFGENDIPGYGLTNIDFTVEFANPVEKELVNVFVGIPGLPPFGMPIIMTPLALEVHMTPIVDEVKYLGTIPLGDVKAVVVAWINHMSGLDPGVPGYIDPDQPWESLPSDFLYTLHTLGCIPLSIYVLAGDPCCIETCEYPFLVDPVGPFANLEVELKTCEIPGWDGCDPIGYPGHELIISTETPGDCTLEECCDDTCCGIDGWEAYILPCYYIGEDPPPLCEAEQGPFDECCDFDESRIVPDCPWWYDWNDECPVLFGTWCVHDWADPYGYHPEIDDRALSDIWESMWYLYVKMTDCAGNTTEYKARLSFAYSEADPGDWTITIDGPVFPLCDDATDWVFGADFCVGPHF